MTSRERVLRCLEYDLKGRVPRDIWALPWAELYHPEKLKRIRADFPSDFASSPGFYKTEPQTVGDAYALGEFIDEWNCTWVNMQAGLVGEIKDPLIKSVDDLSSLILPVELLSVDKEKVNSFCRETDSFVTQGTCARPFERLQFLRKTENLYIDLAEGTDNLKNLIDEVHGFYLKEMEVWADTDVDALFFMDDWGAQQSLLISPVMWRDLFKPLYRDYIDLAHSKGKKIFMHSDGYIADILPDLIELGLDAVNSQIFCMGLENLEQYRGQICFWGEIDRQHLLPNGSTQDIKNAVKGVYEHLSKSGGVIAQCEFGAGANPDNVYSVFQTWDELTGLQ
ncbi:MAG: methyltransferase [Spirochaetales bacterium]|jgi:uroporphyrinogen decarboxylase|nr:methyltransferase [Spirochaetales bacterium]